jgi:hypothetical protein
MRFEDLNSIAAFELLYDYFPYTLFFPLFVEDWSRDVPTVKEITRHFSYDAHGTLQFDLVGMARDKFFSSLFPKDISEHINGTTGERNVYKFYIDQIDANFIAGFNAGVPVPQEITGGSGIPELFFQDIERVKVFCKYDVYADKSGGSFKWDFSTLLMHSTHSIYKAYYYYAKKHYNLRLYKDEFDAYKEEHSNDVNVEKYPVAYFEMTEYVLESKPKGTNFFWDIPTPFDDLVEKIEGQAGHLGTLEYKAKMGERIGEYISRFYSEESLDDIISNDDGKSSERSANIHGFYPTERMALQNIDKEHLIVLFELVFHELTEQNYIANIKKLDTNGLFDAMSNYRGNVHNTDNILFILYKENVIGTEMNSTQFTKKIRKIILLILFEEQFAGEEAFLNHLKDEHPDVLTNHINFLQYVEQETFPVLRTHLGYYQDENNTATINPKNKLFKNYCKTMGMNIEDSDIHEIYKEFCEKMRKIIEKCGFMTEEDKKKA